MPDLAAQNAYQQSAHAEAGGTATVTNVVFDLIGWAIRRGSLPALLQAAYDAAPDNPRLGECLRSLGVSSGGANC